MSEIGGLQEPDVLPPPPEEPGTLNLKEGCRLWIGNLDSRVTEFNMLKLMQKHGTLKKFDFIYHKKGPDAGKPRGYCFATYSTLEEAEKARLALDGKLALSRRLAVRYANADRQSDVLTKITATTGKRPDDNPISKNAKILAIEAKLRRMENTEDKGPLPSTNSQRFTNSHYSSTARGHSSTVRGHSSGHPYSRGHSSKESHSHSKRR